MAARPDRGKKVGGRVGIMIPQVVLYKEEMDTRVGHATYGLGEDGPIKFFLGDGIGGKDVPNPTWDADTPDGELRPWTDIPIANEVIAGARFQYEVSYLGSKGKKSFINTCYPRRDVPPAVVAGSPASLKNRRRSVWVTVE